MFKIEWNSSEEIMFEETQKHLREIDGIQEFIELTKEIFGHEWLCWGDDQIDELEYMAKAKQLTVRICSSNRDVMYNGGKVRYIFWMIDFFDVEIEYFDICPEHWIDEIYIQKNTDGKYSITFGTGCLDFRYSYAKVNRCWVENYK